MAPRRKKVVEEAPAQAVVSTEAAAEVKASAEAAEEVKKAPVRRGRRKASETAAEKPAAKTAKAAEKAPKAVKTTRAKKSTAAEKAPAVKAEEVKAPAPKKRPGRKPALKAEVFVQYLGKDVSAQDIVEQVRKIWTDEMGKEQAEISDLKIYFKTEENRAYYVINGDVSGSVEI